MTEQQIRDGFGRIDGALAPPLDAAERIEHRVRVRRRRRRAAVGAGTALALATVAGTVVTLASGDGGRDAVAVDQPSGPASTLVMTRPDGSTYAFPDVTVSCQPPEGEDVTGGPARIWATSPRHIEGERVTEPFVYVAGIVDKIAGGRSFTFPNDWSTSSDKYPIVVFVADTDGNEAASSAGEESGTVRVLEASCDPVPVLRLAVDMTLGSEVGKSSLDLAGALR